MIIVYVLIALVIIVLIVAAILPKAFKVTTDVTINQPQDKVWDFVRLIRHQEQYSIWIQADPNINMTYEGVDGEVGFSAARHSDLKNVGVGKQTIVAIDPGTSYTVEIDFEKPMQSTNESMTSLLAHGPAQTIVTNTLYGVTPRPMNLMTRLFLPKLKQDMSQNLRNLKNIIESNHQISANH